MPKILILIGAALILGSVLPFIYGAHWAFYLYEFIYFLNPEHRWWYFYVPGLPYSKISVIILLLMFMVKFKQLQKNKLIKIPQFKWFVMLLITYASVSSYALAPEIHEEALVNYFKLFVIMSIAYKVLDSQNKLEWALLAYIVGCTYIGYEAHAVGRNSGDRVEGIGLIDAPDSNGVSAAIAPVIPFLIYYFWLGSKKVKLMITIAGALIVNGIVLINSRGAFLGAAVSGLYFMWEMYTSKIKVNHQKLMVIFLLIMGVLALLVVMDSAFIDRMLTLTEVEDEEKSGSHRYHMWLTTFDMMRDYPWGVGAYGYNLLSPQYVDQSLFGKGQIYKSVHSLWFQAMYEVGWHGFFFFVMIIFTTLKMAYKTRAICKKRQDVRQYYLAHALLCSFLGMLTASTFINQFRVQIVYWSILFIACFYSIVRNQENSEATLKESRASKLPP